MALNAANAANAVGTKVTVAERWIKLYRKIHNLFLKNDFTNRNDFEFTLRQLNLRIDSLEKQLNAAVTALNSSITALNVNASVHVHTGNLAAPTSPSLVPLIPGPPAVPPITPQAQTTKQFVEQRDQILQATGEPVVPLDTSASI